MAGSSIQRRQLQILIGAIGAAVLINRRKDLKLIPKLLEQNDGKTKKMLVGTGIIFAFDRVIGEILKRKGLKLPSSLVSMVSVYILLQIYEAVKGKEEAEAIGNWFRPAVEHLGKWMTLYLCPPLVVLPNALSEVKGGGASTWIKLGAVHGIGYLTTLLSTAYIAKALQRLQEGSGEKGGEEADEKGTGSCSGGGGGGGGGGGSSSSSGKAGGASAQDKGGEAAAEGQGTGEDDEDENDGSDEVRGAVAGVAAAAAATTSMTPSSSSSSSSSSLSSSTESAAEKKTRKANEMKKAWTTLTAVAYFLLPFYGPAYQTAAPATAATTVLAMIHANALPAKVKKVVHPLLVTAVVTGVAAVVLGKLEGGSSVKASLTNYFKKAGMLSGSGDLFFGFLNASCAALGFRMFDERKRLQDNFTTLVGSTAFASMASLFGTTAACAAVDMPPLLCLTLAQRSVMSSLGIPAAQLLGGNSAVAVACILLTGVYGASFGQSILDSIGVGKDDIVARGAATGASAHSIGTAALMSGGEDQAAAIASVALCLSGVFHSAVCSVPAAQDALRRIAGSAVKSATS